MYEPRLTIIREGFRPTFRSFKRHIQNGQGFVMVSGFDQQKIKKPNAANNEANQVEG